MNERGFTLLEMLVALAAGSAMVAALVVLVVTTSRFGIQADDQAAIQRQAASIMDEIAQQVQPAGCTPTNPTCTPLQIDTCQGVANSLRVTNPDVDGLPQSFCFRRNVAGEPSASDLADTRIVRDWEKPPGTLIGTKDLLAGALIRRQGTVGQLTTADGATVDGGGNCGPTAGFCPGVTGSPPAIGPTSGPTACLPADPSACRIATVTFRLRSHIPETSSYQTMMFETTITRRD